MKAILKVATYKSKQQALSHCAHILRKHGHPEESKEPDVITIIDKTQNIADNKIQAENLKQLQEEKRSLSKKLGVYQKRHNDYIASGKEKLADKQKVKINGLNEQLATIDNQLNNIDTFAKTALKSNSVKYIELILIWTDTPPTNQNADDLTLLSKEFIVNKFGEDFYNQAIAIAVHKDQSSIHVHAMFQLNSNWYSALKTIDKDPRNALSILNYEFNNFCQEQANKYKFDNLTSGNEYLPLSTFKQNHANFEYKKEAILQTIEQSVNQSLSDICNIQHILHETLKNEIVLNTTLKKVAERTMKDKIFQNDADFIDETKSNLSAIIQKKNLDQLLILSPTIKKIRKSSIDFEFTLHRLKDFGNSLKTKLLNSIKHILKLSENDIFQLRRKNKPYLHMQQPSEGCDIVENSTISPEVTANHLDNLANSFIKYEANAKDKEPICNTTPKPATKKTYDTISV